MEPTADELLELLGSELNRCILTLTSDDELSADAIADRCDASLPTVYRHIDDLRSAGLISERLEFDSAGNHYKRYRSGIDVITIEVADGDLSTNVEGMAKPETDDLRPTPDTENVD